jgi:transposase
MNKETIILTETEQQRVQVLLQVQHGRLATPEAARLLGISGRHVKRLLAGLRKRGLAALAHGNRGRASPRRLSDALRTRTLALARTTYAGCNDCHFTELLAEREGVHVSRPTVQRLLRANGIPTPRRHRPPRHRSRREPMPQAGLLVQMDGSHHPWLEDRGPRLVLHGAIDDATGRVLGGVFRPEEDAHGYFLLLRQIIRRHGVPAAAYTDRHGIFRRDARLPLTLAEQLDGTVEATQVGRALQELGIRWIPAQSPQGKGRVERLFGTFQDRLVSELRLAQARTLSEAQRVLARFLPRYNARFAHPPAHPEPAWRPAPANLDRICCFKYLRTVQHDNTVLHDGRVLQLRPGLAGRSYAGARVEVHAHLNGTLAISYRGQRLAITVLPRGPHPSQRPENRLPPRIPHPTTPPPPAEAPASTRALPAADHPWRRTVLTGARRKLLQYPEVTDSLSI